MYLMKALGALLLTSTQLGASRSQLLKKGHQEEGEMLHTRVFCPFLEKFFTVICVSLSASASQLGSCGLCPRDQTLGLIISDYGWKSALLLFIGCWSVL